MTDPSLNRRLDHHARRSGFAIGASMALTIVLLIGGFVWLFAMINPYLSDFLGAQAAPSMTPTAQTARAGAAAAPTNAPAPPTATPPPAPSPTPSPSPTAAPSQSANANGTNDEFTADYRILPEGESVNFRSVAGTDGSETLEVLDPGTSLQSTDEEETVDGVVWLEFTTEDGKTGWIREIDTEAV